MQRQKHRARLRATIEEQTILKGTGVGDAIGRDDQTHETRFWDFGDRWSRSLRKASDRPCGFRVHGWEGGKLRSRPLQTGPRRTCQCAITTPRFRRALRCWRKEAPRQSRLPMLELFMWVLAVFLLHFESAGLALYLVVFFHHALALPQAHCECCGRRRQFQRAARQGPHHVLAASPFQGFATKNGDYDETVTSDGAVCPVVGRLLKRQADHMLKSKEHT